MLWEQHEEDTVDGVRAKSCDLSCPLELAGLRNPRGTHAEPTSSRCLQLQGSRFPEHFSFHAVPTKITAQLLRSPEVACSISVPAHWPMSDNLVSSLHSHIPQNGGQAAAPAGRCASKMGVEDTV